MEELVRRICTIWVGDPSMPSLVISWLGEGKGWYCSIVRYMGRWGEGKYVVTNAVHRELGYCMRLLVTKLDSLLSLRNELQITASDSVNDRVVAIETCLTRQDELLKLIEQTIETSPSPSTQLP